jgi:hypothetical protein
MAAKKRDCKHCGVAHALTEKFWYLYEGRSPICRVQESDRQKLRAAKKPAPKKTAAKKTAKKGTAKKK